MKLLNYQEAINSANSSERHILLGNGFSIACKPNIFSYKRLWAEAEKNGLLRDTLSVFQRLETSDFERVIKSLRDAAKALGAYPGVDPSTVAKIHADAEMLREILVTTIAKNHPDHPAEIPDVEYEHCRNFLASFGKLFTTSYDLLLYWTIMHEPGPEALNKRNDGFKKPLSGNDPDYVSWEQSRSWYQNVFYLHGALHIFDSGTEIKKFTWNNTEIRLIQQIRSALAVDLFPIFVSEGSSEEKYGKIRHSDFLSKGYMELSMLKGSLFVFGHSFGDSDMHIVRAIAQSKVSKVFVGLFGEACSVANLASIQKANMIPVLRKHEDFPVEVYFCDSSSASVWR